MDPTTDPIATHRRAQVLPRLLIAIGLAIAFIFLLRAIDRMFESERPTVFAWTISTLPVGQRDAIEGKLESVARRHGLERDDPEVHWEEDGQSWWRGQWADGHASLFLNFYPGAAEHEVCAEVTAYGPDVQTGKEQEEFLQMTIEALVAVEHADRLVAGSKCANRPVLGI